MAAKPIIKIGGRRSTMSVRTLAFLTIFCLGTWLAASAQSEKGAHMPTHAHVRAEAKTTVHSSEAKPYDQTASPALMELHLSETFSGDIEGESTVRALQVVRDDRSASMVSVQRVRGKLGGRQGTFVLQGSEIIENGKIKARWFVVPRSGKVSFPDCAARAALKASLEKAGPRQRWSIGSNDQTLEFRASSASVLIRRVSRGENRSGFRRCPPR